VTPHDQAAAEAHRPGRDIGDTGRSPRRDMVVDRILPVMTSNASSRGGDVKPVVVT
jgi:hypothetical protein